MLHGNQAVIAWPEGWFENAGGGNQISSYVKSLIDVFAAVQGEAGKYIVSKDSCFSADPIGIYYSHPSIQAGWAMDAIVHGKTWPRRLSSIDNKNQSSGTLLKVWCKTLEDLGYQYNFINYLDVMESNIDLNRMFKVIILPKTICLSKKEAEVFKRFVAKGGVLVADYLCGIFDEHGKWRGKGALDDFFGIRRNDSAGYLNGRGVSEIDAEKYKKPFNQRFTYYSGAFDYKNIVIFERGTQQKNINGHHSISENKNLPDVIIENQFKQGSAWYLNLSPIKYWSSVLRLSHFGENWRAVVSEILNEAGLKPRVRIVKENNFPGMVESLFWKNGQDIYLGIIANPSDGLESVKGKSGQITLIFGKRICAINLRSGQKFQKVKIIKDDFLPWEGNVYKIKF
jgi:hypothetical protein